MTLKDLRLENNKSRSEVAAVLGIAYQTLAQYENGVRRIGLEHILILSKLYECTAEEIIKAQLNSCLITR